jgi:hypothetical protein
MTVSYIIIIVIIWKKSSVKIKDQTSNERNEKSKMRRLIPSKKSLIGRNPSGFYFSSDFLLLCKIDDHQMESSIRNARSLGVIPRAKIKTVKMTLVIVIGKIQKHIHPRDVSFFFSL